MTRGLRMLLGRALCLVTAFAIVAPSSGIAQTGRKEAPASKHIETVEPALFSNVLPGEDVTFRVTLKNRRRFDASRGDGLVVTTTGNVTASEPRQVSDRVFEVDLVSTSNGQPGVADVVINFTTPKGKAKFVRGGHSVGGNSLGTVDSSSNRLLRSVGVGESPWGVDTAGPVSIGAGRAFVANSGAGTVSVVEIGADRVIRTVTVGSGPRHVVVAGPTGNQFAYVTNFDSDTVSVIDAEDYRVVRTIAVGDGPIGIDLIGTPGNEFAYVANFNSDSVTVIDTRIQEVFDTFAVGDGPTGIGVGGPIGGQIVVVTEQNQNTAALILSNNNTLLARLAVGSRPVFATAGGVSNSRAVVVNSGGSISVIDLGQRRVLRSVNVGSQPLGAVIVGPSAAPFAYVANNGSGTLSVVDLGDYRVIRTIFIGGRPRGVTAIGAPGSEQVLATN